MTPAVADPVDADPGAPGPGPSEPEAAEPAPATSSASAPSPAAPADVTPRDRAQILGEALDANAKRLSQLGGALDPKETIEISPPRRDA